MTADGPLRHPRRTPRPSGFASLHLVTLGLALAGFAIQAFLAPTVVVVTTRSETGRVSADVSWTCLFDLVTLRRVHIDDFRGAQVVTLRTTRSMSDKRGGPTSTSRLVLRSGTGSWTAQLVADEEAVHEAQRRLEAFRNCINCSAEEETTVVPGGTVFRYVGAGLMLFGGSLFALGVPLSIVRALRGGDPGRR